MAIGNQGQQGFQNALVPFFEAGNTVITKAGLFTFSGTPAPGNLFTSDAPAAGIIKGNHYLSGFTIYNPSVAIQFNGFGFQFYTGSLIGGWNIVPGLFLTFQGTTPAQMDLGGPIAMSQLTIGPNLPATPILAQPFVGVELQQSAGGLIAASFTVVGDTVARLNVDSNGKLQWGPGNAAVDTNLYRRNAGILHSDNDLEANTLNIPQNFANAKHFGVDANGLIYLIDDNGVTNIRALSKQAADAQNRWTMDSNGEMKWGPGNAATDTDLFRNGPGQLATDNQFSAVGVISTFAGFTAIQAPSTNLVFTVEPLGGPNPSFDIDANGKMQWGTGAAALDTSLERTSANTLMVDNTIVPKVGGVAETWHSLGAFPTAGITTIVGRYRMLPDGDVEIDILFSTAAAVATFSANFPNVLPAAYRPTQNKINAVAMTGANWTISASRFPNCLVDTLGNVQVNMPAIPGAIANIGCTFRFPTN